MNPTALAIPVNMKPYTVAFLYPGPRYAEFSDMKNPEAFALQAKHLDEVRSNVEAGLQILAAPVITPGGKLSALGIFHPHVTVEQVTEIMQRDPAVAVGRFTFEVHQAFFPSLDSVKVEY